MFWRLLLYGFLFYLLYKFIFQFAIPVYRATKKVKKSFREMHERMQEQANQQQPPPNFTQPAKEKGKPGDYIDFEEVE